MRPREEAQAIAVGVVQDDLAEVLGVVVGFLKRPSLLGKMFSQGGEVGDFVDEAVPRTGFGRGRPGQDGHDGGGADHEGIPIVFEQDCGAEAQHIAIPGDQSRPVSRPNFGGVEAELFGAPVHGCGKSAQGASVGRCVGWAVRRLGGATVGRIEEGDHLTLTGVFL